jgi:hypothetical protein
MIGVRKPALVLLMGMTFGCKSEKDVRDEIAARCRPVMKESGRAWEELTKELLARPALDDWKKGRAELDQKLLINGYLWERRLNELKSKRRLDGFPTGFAGREPTREEMVLALVVDDRADRIELRKRFDKWSTDYGAFYVQLQQEYERCIGEPFLSCSFPSDPTTLGLFGDLQAKYGSTTPKDTASADVFAPIDRDWKGWRGKLFDVSDLLTDYRTARSAAEPIALAIASNPHSLRVPLPSLAEFLSTFPTAIEVATAGGVSPARLQEITEVHRRLGKSCEGLRSFEDIYLPEIEKKIGLD